MDNQEVLNILKRLRSQCILTKQEYRTIKGQTNNGDVEAAFKGLKRLLRRKGVQV